MLQNIWFLWWLSLEVRNWLFFDLPYITVLFTNKIMMFWGDPKTIHGSREEGDHKTIHRAEGPSQHYSQGYALLNLEHRILLCLILYHKKSKAHPNSFFAVAYMYMNIVFCFRGRGTFFSALKFKVCFWTEYAVKVRNFCLLATVIYTWNDQVVGTLVLTCSLWAQTPPGIQQNILQCVLWKFFSNRNTLSLWNPAKYMSSQKTQ